MTSLVLPFGQTVSPFRKKERVYNPLPYLSLSLSLSLSIFSDLDVFELQSPHENCVTASFTDTESRPFWSCYCRGIPPMMTVFLLCSQACPGVTRPHYPLKGLWSPSLAVSRVLVEMRWARTAVVVLSRNNSTISPTKSFVYGLRFGRPGRIHGDHEHWVFYTQWKPESSSILYPGFSRKRFFSRGTIQ